MKPSARQLSRLTSAAGGVGRPTPPAIARAAVIMVVGGVLVFLTGILIGIS